MGRIARRGQRFGRAWGGGVGLARRGRGVRSSYGESDGSVGGDVRRG